MNIFETVRSLNLPTGTYLVFGSGPMAARGLREPSDIDLLVTDDLYRRLKNEGWEEKQWSDGGISLVKSDVEAFNTWNFGTYRPNSGELIADAEIIEGIPFAPLTEVLKWKQAFGREKDLKDVQILQKYLSSN